MRHARRKGRGLKNSKPRAAELKTNSDLPAAAVEWRIVIDENSSSRQLAMAVVDIFSKRKKQLEKATTPPE
jgi:hypothetical protein